MAMKMVSSRVRVFSLYINKWRCPSPYRVRNVSTMFNREREFELLSSSLEKAPGLHILTGPVNSGKSLLLEKIAESFQRSHVPVETINLRQLSFDSVDSLVCSLEDVSNSWLQKFVKASQHYELDAEPYGFKFKLDVSRHQLPHATPLTRLGELLAQLENKLPHYTFWRGTKAPILIIDEGNELRALLKDDDGEAALHNLFKWLVLNTKEKRRFHTVFASSDSFFHLWISQFVGAARYQCYLIDDLNKEEAKIFWTEKLQETENHLITRNKVVPPWPDFEIIYSMCGGNMFLIEKALDYWETGSSLKRAVDWKNFPFYAQELSKLTKAYFLSSLCEHKVGKAKPKWTGSVMLEVMRQLITAPEGVLSYYKLCEKYGPTSIDSLIEHNIFLLRPSAQCNFGVKKSIEDGVITAETPCGFNAMKAWVARKDETSDN